MLSFDLSSLLSAFSVSLYSSLFFLSEMAWVVDSSWYPVCCVIMYKLGTSVCWRSDSVSPHQVGGEVLLFHPVLDGIGIAVSVKYTCTNVLCSNIKCLITIVKLVGSRGIAHSVVPQSLLNVYPVPAYSSASCTALHVLKVLPSGLSEDFQPVTLGLVNNHRGL